MASLHSSNTESIMFLLQRFYSLKLDLQLLLSRINLHGVSE